MPRYRIVFVPPGHDGVTVEYFEAESAALAIDQLTALYGIGGPRSTNPNDPPPTVVSVRIDKRDPVPTPTPVSIDVVLESLARALLRENTVLLALLSQPIFAASLNPQRLASLQQVTADAQAALDLAQSIGVEVKP